MKAAARALIFVLFLSLTFFLRAQSVFGNNETNVNQTPETQYQFLSPNTENDVPKNLHTYIQSAMIETLSALTCFTAGIDPLNPKGCLGINSQTQKIGYVSQNPSAPGGAIGAMGGLITATFNIPISHHQYTAYLSENFGIVKSANAQSIGLQALAPVFRIWEAFRNIVYMLFVLVLVVIGIGVMFRLQIDPRTVMTIQNQIPKIIVGLIGITLSYAVAGFLVEMMWIIIRLLFVVFANIDPDINRMLNHLYNTPVGFADSIYNQISLPFGITIPINHGILSIASNAANAVTAVVGTTISGAIQLPLIGELFTTLIVFLFNGFGGIGCLIDSLKISVSLSNTSVNLNPGSPIGCINNLGILSATGVGYLIVFLIMFIAIMFSLFRLWFQLIKTYIFIFIDVILAPFWIFAGLIPGAGGGFGSWFKDIVANLMVFPTVIFMFLLAKVIMQGFSSLPADQQFAPPLIGNNAQADVFSSLIGFGIILLTPAAVAMVKDAFKTPGFKHLATVGAMTAVGSGVVGSAVGGVWSRMTRVDQYGAPRGILSIKAYEALRDSNNRIGRTLFNAGRVFGGWRRGYERHPETGEIVGSDEARRAREETARPTAPPSDTGSSTP